MPTTEWPPAILEVGPVHVDTGSRFVHVNGTLCPELTRKEYALLIALAKAGEHGVKAKRELVRAIWDENFDPYTGDRRLDATACRLRAKLAAGMPDGVSLVQNIWGVGYRLVPPALVPA